MVAADLSTFLEQVEAVLAERTARGEAAVARIETTLTDGYARALALEAERWRLERRIGEMARSLGDGDAAERAEQLSTLSNRLATADDELAQLRARLADLRQHAQAVRAA